MFCYRTLKWINILFNLQRKWKQVCTIWIWHYSNKLILVNWFWISPNVHQFIPTLPRCLDVFLNYGSVMVIYMNTAWRFYSVERITKIFELYRFLNGLEEGVLYKPEQMDNILWNIWIWCSLLRFWISQFLYLLWHA